MQIELYLSNARDAYFFKNDIPEGVSVNVPPITVRKGFGEEIAITVLITISTGIPITIIGNWLYDKIKNCSSNKITIDRQEITFDKGQITKIITEKIKKE